MQERKPILPDHVVRGRGKPIVMLPGMEGAKEFWGRQLPALAARYLGEAFWSRFLLS